MTDAGDAVVIPVRWADSDPLGHVSNGVLMSYLDEVRDAHLAATLPGFSRTSYVVARIEVDFVRPVELGNQTVLGRARALELGRSSVLLAEELELRESVVAVAARTRIVFWDRLECRPRPLTATERRVLSADVTSTPVDVGTGHGAHDD